MSYQAHKVKRFIVTIFSSLCALLIFFNPHWINELKAQIYEEPPTANPTSLSLRGTPGETVGDTVFLSGGVPPYQASSVLGASVSLRNGTLTYAYTIPGDTPAGIINDTLTVTDAAGSELPIPVQIQIDGLIVDSVSLTLDGPPGDTIEAQVSISGGVPPYQANSTLADARISIRNGTLTYAYTIPVDTPAGTINDTLTVTDAAGSELSIPVTIEAGESIPLAANPTLDPNEREVAGALDILCPQLEEIKRVRGLTSGERDLLDQCRSLIANSTSPGIQNTLEQITTEKASASTRASIEAANQQLTNISSRLAALRRGATGVSVQGLTLNIGDQRLSGNHASSLVAALVPRQASGGGASGDPAFGRWGLFINGSLHFGDKDTTKNETGFDFDTKGITAGVDYRFTDRFVAGGAIGFAKNDIDFDSSGGDLDTDTWAVSGYGTYYVSDRFYIEGILGYGWHDYTSERNIRYQVSTNTDPVGRSAQADYAGKEYGGSLGAGYNFNKEAWTFGIYGRANYVKVDVDGFREENASGLNLQVEDFAATSVTTTLGGQISRAFSTKKAVFVPELRFEWEHEFDDDATELDVQFVNDPTGTLFNVFTDDPDRDYFRLGLGLSATFPGGVSAFANYDTLIDKADWTDHAINLGVRWEF